MSIKAKKLKSSILKSGKKVGILIAEDSKVDRAITGGAEVTATIINDGEKQAKRLVKGAQSKLDELRAKIHDATAPRAGKK